VSPAHFAEHLAVLRREANVMPLADLIAARLEARRLDRAVAITFDDGYVDNLQRAKPLLDRYDLPATVFVVTGATGDARGFWWDELARLILEPPSLPDRFELRIGDGIVRSCSIRPEPGAAPSKRRLELHFRIYDWLVLLPERQRLEVLDQLAAVVETPAMEKRIDDGAMSANEILALADGGLVEIGAHTVTHPRLVRLEPVSQRWELARSKAACEAVLGRPVRQFSYPFGSHDPKLARLVADVGFGCACTTVRDLVHRRTRPHLVPRVKVDDCDGEAFARQLRRAFSRRETSRERPRHGR
jgi:peptidoglycan/xylan/chitin deacetylase (PgdA/CDA1 family)